MHLYIFIVFQTLPLKEEIVEKELVEVKPLMGYNSVCDIRDEILFDEFGLNLWEELITALDIYSILYATEICKDSSDTLRVLNKSLTEIKEKIVKGKLDEAEKDCDAMEVMMQDSKLTINLTPIKAIISMLKQGKKFDTWDLLEFIYGIEDRTILERALYEDTAKWSKLLRGRVFSDTQHLPKFYKDLIAKIRNPDLPLEEPENKEIFEGLFKVLKISSLVSKGRYFQAQWELQSFDFPFCSLLKDYIHFLQAMIKKGTGEDKSAEELVLNIKTNTPLYLFYHWKSLNFMAIQDSVEQIFQRRGYLPLFYLLLGKEKLCKGDTSEALKLFQKVIQNEKYLITGAFFLTSIYNCKKDYAQTLKFQRITGEPPKYSIFINGLNYYIADALYYTGDIYRDAAMHFYKEIAEKKDTLFSPLSLLSIAWVYIDKKDFDDAEELLKKVSLSDSTMLNYTQAYLFYKKRDFDSAARIFKLLTDAEQNTIKRRSLFYLGIISEENKKTDVAISYYRQLLEEMSSDPISLFTLRRLILLYLKEGDVATAERLTREAQLFLEDKELEGFTTNIFYLFISQFKEKNFEKAMKYARELSHMINSTEPLESLLYERGLKYQKSAIDLSMTIKEIEKLNHKSKYLPELLLYMAKMKLAQDPDSALQIFLRIKSWHDLREVSHILPDVYYYSMKAAEKLGKVNQIINEGRILKTIMPANDPRYPDVLLSLSYSYLQKAEKVKEIEKREFYEKAYELLLELQANHEATSIYMNNRDAIISIINDLEKILKK